MSDAPLLSPSQREALKQAQRDLLEASLAVDTAEASGVSAEELERLILLEQEAALRLQGLLAGKG